MADGQTTEGVGCEIAVNPALPTGVSPGVAPLTFDDALEAIQAGIAFPVHCSVHYADAEITYDYATLFPCGKWNATLGLDNEHGELVLYAAIGHKEHTSTERAWHLTAPTQPECMAEPVVPLEDALAEAAKFLGWERKP